MRSLLYDRDLPDTKITGLKISNFTLFISP